MAAERAKIQSLEKKKAGLLLQHQVLLKGRQKLLLRQSLLTAWCEALSLLQHVQGQSQHPEAAADPDVQAQFQELLNEEVALLGELTFSEQLSSCSIGASTALPDPGPETLSPGNPVAYFKKCLAQGPIPEAAQWTALDIASMLRETVLQASLQRTLQQASLQDQSVPPAKELWDRYLRVLMSSIVLGREHVNERIALYNLDTLKAAPENAAAAEQRTATIPPLLGLTAHQMDIISAGVETCEGLTAQLHKQREQVMRQLEAAAAADEATGSTSEHSSQQPSACSGASQGPATSLSVSDLRPLGTFEQRQQHLQTQQQLAARLKLLMAKQYMLILTLGSLVMGCLTYDQVSRACLLTWPYSVRVISMADSIRKLRQQQLAEEQRQQQQQRQRRQLSTQPAKCDSDS